MTYYVNSDWSRFVPEGDPDSAWGVDETDIDRLGLRDALDAFLAAPAVEAKEAPKPEDKAWRKPVTKTRKEP